MLLSAAGLKFLQHPVPKWLVGIVALEERIVQLVALEVALNMMHQIKTLAEAEPEGTNMIAEPLPETLPEKILECDSNEGAEGNGEAPLRC